MLLIYLMTPAAVELTENVVHLVMTGHSAHAFGDGAHRPDGPEHGCSGIVHVCGCHSSVSFIPANAYVAIESVGPAEIVGTWVAERSPTREHRSGVYRPPMA